jgi:hypothetical protein
MECIDGIEPAQPAAEELHRGPGECVRQGWKGPGDPAPRREEEIGSAVMDRQVVAGEVEEGWIEGQVVMEVAFPERHVADGLVQVRP